MSARRLPASSRDTRSRAAWRRRFGARGAGGLALLLVLAGCTGSGGSAGSPRASGGEPTQVGATTGATAGASPSQSAGEERVGGAEGHGSDLYRIDPTTGGAELVRSVEGGGREPERSPDGSLLAYQGADPRGTPQIFVVANGKPRQLTDLEGGAIEPAWSPDGSRIAFAGVASAGEDSDIFVMDADGRHLRVLARTASGRRPDWSPDGSRIVFDTYTDIWVAAVDDGGHVRSLEIAGIDLRTGPVADAAWSPDGRLIAFTRVAPGSINGLLPYAHLWVVRLDGTGERRVNPPFKPGVFELDPTWSPDGRSIAFTDVERNRIGIVDLRKGRTVFLRTPFTVTDLSWGGDGLIGRKGADPSPPIRIGFDDDRNPFP